ncbi:MAG: hypothetical protein AB7G21_07260 [Dehalococcoidia bacterium]
MFSFHWNRSALLVGIVTAVVVAAIALPGTFGTALAQTDGFDPGTGGGGGRTTTDPTTGTTTTTTTNPITQTTTTTTTRTDGTTSTSTTTPNGETTTVVTIPNQGTVTIVQAPNQPATVTVAPANPNTDTTMQVETLSAVLAVPAGTLGADETISIVETSFSLAIVIGVQAVNSPAALGQVTGAGIVNFAGEPGSITPVRVFEMTVKTGSGGVGQIDKPIRMTWDFKPEHLAAAGGDFANLLMIGQDATTGKWSPVPQVAKTATSVTFEVPHFSLWAFAVRTPGAVATPAAPQATPAAGTTPAAGATTAPTAPTPVSGVVPRPANTGTGIPAEAGTSLNLLAVAASVLLLGTAAGGTALAVRRRR